MNFLSRSALATVLFTTALTGAAHADETVAPEPKGKGQGIIGGYTPHPSQWPWMAAVGHSRNALPNSTGYQRHFCGGALVAPRVVITAAHCVVTDGVQTAPGSLSVALGRRHLNQTGGEEHAVVAVSVHASYSGQTFRNDVALLRLASDSAQTPAALDQGFRLTQGMRPTVMGWGYDRVGGERTEDLRAADVALFSSTRCDASYADFAWKHHSDVMLCAGWDEGGNNTCQGDSGGPLMLPDATNTWRLIGLVSWADRCAIAGRPTNFTYVNAASNRDWIAGTIAALSQSDVAPAATPVPWETTTPEQDPAGTQVEVTPPAAIAAALSRVSARGRTLRFTLSRTARVTLVVTLSRGSRTYTLRGAAGRNVARLPRLRGASRVTLTTRADGLVRRATARVR